MTTMTPDRDERMIGHRTLPLGRFVHRYEHIITLSQHRGLCGSPHLPACGANCRATKGQRREAGLASACRLRSSQIDPAEQALSPSNPTPLPLVPLVPLVHCMPCPLPPSRSGKAEEALNLQEKASRSFLTSTRVLACVGQARKGKNGKPCGCMLCRPAGRVPSRAGGARMQRILVHGLVEDSVSWYVATLRRRCRARGTRLGRRRERNALVVVFYRISRMNFD
jgi:hypothetical protein